MFDQLMKVIRMECGMRLWLAKHNVGGEPSEALRLTYLLDVYYPLHLAWMRLPDQAEDEMLRTGDLAEALDEGVRRGAVAPPH